MSKFRILFSLLAVVIIVTAFSTATFAATAAWIPPSFPEVKDEIDNQIAQQMATKGIVTDSAIVTRVQKIYDRLKAGSPKDDWSKTKGVVAVNDPTANAGSSVSYAYINTGMIEATQSDDELAFVIGHEIGHTFCGHIGLNYTDYCTRCIESQMIFGKDAASVLRIYQFIQPGLTKDQEYDADQIGYELAVAAGYDGKKIIEFMKRLSTPADNPKGVAAWISSHPGMDKRVVTLEQHLATKKIAQTAHVVETDVAPFLPLLENKPIDGWTSCSFNHKLFFVCIKSGQPLRVGKSKIFLPVDVAEVYFVYRNPEPTNWLQACFLGTGISVMLANVIKPAMAIKAPAEYLLRGEPIYLIGCYGSSSGITEDSADKNMPLKSQQLTFAPAK